MDCNQCGAGDGLNLVEKALKLTASKAACQINGILGALPDMTTAVTITQTNTEAARQRASVQAQALVKSASRQTHNAYLSAKG